MSKRLLILAGLIVLTFAFLGLGLTARRRIVQAREFQQPHRVVGADGTEYTAQLIEAAVGKTDTGYLIILYARFQNQNPKERTLVRAGFVLADAAGVSYRPSASGTQSELIALGANGVREREAFSYAVPAGALARGLWWQIGPTVRVPLKSDRPFRRELHSGEFISFRRGNW